MVGPYRILEHIGEGGMGVVYRARDVQLRRDVALKLFGDSASSPSSWQRFLREAQFLASINHPHVLQIYNIGEFRELPYFAMELLEGSLADQLRLKKPSIELAKQWVLEAALGLAAIHEKGLLHRDIKLHNLLLSKASSTEPARVKVADLGIALDLQLNRLTRVGSSVGTDGYMAPEVIFGEPVDHRSDQYALGVVAFELLTNQHPYPGLGLESLLQSRAIRRTPPDPRALTPTLDAATAGLVMRMLQDDPAQRVQSDAELIAAWRQVSTTQSTPIAMPSTAARAPEHAWQHGTWMATPPPTRLPVWVTVLLSVALTLLVALLLLMWLAAADEKQPVKAGTLTQSPSVVGLAENPPKTSGKFDPDDLLYRYQLTKDGETDSSWQFEIFDRRGKNFAARLRGPIASAITMTGKIVSQREEVFDGETWTMVEMAFKDKEARKVEIEVQYTESSVAGSGFYIEGEQTQHFEINSADAL